MLWYKSWLETRRRFLFGLVVLTLSSAGAVLSYPEVVRLLPVVPAIDLRGELGQRVKEALELARDYRSYVWSQWFAQNMPQMWSLFAVLLGGGGLLSQSVRGGAVFTLSLPVTRQRLLGVRAATGLLELLVLALVPSLVLPLLSPAIGQSYGVGDALVHGGCMFVAGAVFFSLTFLLSTEFNDIWRPILIVVCIGFGLLAVEQLFRDRLSFSLFRVMNGETYFRQGSLPWPGLAASAAASAAMLYGAGLNIGRKDF